MASEGDEGRLRKPHGVATPLGLGGRKHRATLTGGEPQHQLVRHTGHALAALDNKPCPAGPVQGRVPCARVGYPGRKPGGSSLAGDGVGCSEDE